MKQAILRRCKGCSEFFEITDPKSRKKYCGVACRVRAKYWRDKPRRNVARVLSEQKRVRIGNCPICNELMYSPRPHQMKFCSPRCRQAAYRNRKSQQAQGENLDTY